MHHIESESAPSSNNVSSLKVVNVKILLLTRDDDDHEDQGQRGERERERQDGGSQRLKFFGWMTTMMAMTMYVHGIAGKGEDEG